MVLLNATYLRRCIRLCVVYIGELCPCCLPCLPSSIQLPFLLPFFCQRTCDVCVVPVRHCCPINFQNKIQYMFALPEIKQVTFECSERSLWPACREMMMNKRKCFFSFFDIQYPVSADSIANTSNQSRHRSERSTVDGGKCFSHVPPIKLHTAHLRTWFSAALLWRWGNLV